MMEDALDHEAIPTVKGKRTKRQRLLSPSKDGECLATHKALTVIDGFSPSKSSSEYYDCEGTTTTTEEEEDMANCLILLAQGDRPRRPVVKLSAAVEDDQEYGRATSRKHLETDTGLGKIGYYVYECKTCNRNFPSFQALGGHRASHKKPKLSPNPTMAIPTSDEEGQTGESKKYSSLSPQFGNSNNGLNNLGKQGKAHQCLICGAEFGLGQALGGHMRRHRVPPTPPHIRIAKLVESKDVAVTTTMSLDLDLNLPAPEGRKVENVFLIRQREKQLPLTAMATVFLSPAMVDCHY